MIHYSANGTYVDDELSYSALDDIYHSTDMYEMKVKADMHNIDLRDPRAIIYLIDTTAYHHAFWPHTAKRFTAFKALLRSMKDLPAIPGFFKIVEHVNASIEEIDCQNPVMNTPGRRQELKNLQQVLSILNKLYDKHESRKHKQRQ